MGSGERGSGEVDVRIVDDFGDVVLAGGEGFGVVAEGVLDGGGVVAVGVGEGHGLALADDAGELLE